MTDLATVFAMASGAGRAAVAVMRISGTQTAAVLLELAGGELPVPRRASLRWLRDRGGEVLDHALVLWMPGPASYSGEDSAELHLHAGPAVIEAVADALLALGARPAAPGEFTRRAFLNGRMGLTEAEGIADLIEAESAAQRLQALRQLDGGLARVFDGWSARLTAMLARQEAAIDFPEETGEAVGVDAAYDGIGTLVLEMQAHLADDRRGERLRSGLRIAVIGPPNVGKSSLVNLLAGREAAIVAAVAGTTRDVIEVPVILGGVKAVLLDTAGLRESDDVVEAEGIKRARHSAATADLVVSVREAGTPADAESKVDDGAAGRILLTSKVDRGDTAPGTLGVSVMSGEGINALRALLAERAQALTWQTGPAPLTRARHRAACLEVVDHLKAALQAPMTELLTEELRLASRALGQVTGRVGVENVLDAVFSQFCIGK